jgi:putative endonuclease
MQMMDVRKPWWRRWFGNRSERAAARYLKGLGYRILVRNYACPLGELDLIAFADGCIVFVEVRSTAGDSLKAAASVDDRKQKQLTKLAVHFLQSKKLLNQAARFDVLAVSWPADQSEPAIVHYQNAFEAVGRWQLFN